MPNATKTTASVPAIVARAAAGAAFVALAWSLARIPHPYADWPRFRVLGLGLGALLAAVALLTCWRRWRWPWAVVIALAALGVGARVALIPQRPSNDVWRYLWEGRVQRAGHNPYVIPPSAPALAALRTPDDAKINHPDWPAIYGPLAELTFRALAAVSPTVTAWKLTLLACELGVLALLAALLIRLERSPVWLLGYAWHPLVLWSVAGEAHLEGLLLLPLLGGLLALLGGRVALAGALLAAAALVKPTAARFLPLLVLSEAGWRGAARGLAAAAAVTLLVVWPYADAGRGLFASLWRFGADMRFNDLPSLLAGRWLSPEALKLCAAALMLAVGGLVVWRRPPVATGAVWLGGAWLLLSPTVHPWYGVVLVPLLCLAGGPGWWTLSVSLILAGETTARELRDGHWLEVEGVRAWIYGSAALAAVIGLIWRRLVTMDTECHT